MFLSQTESQNLTEEKGKFQPGVYIPPFSTNVGTMSSRKIFETS